eukprot:Ihof_evm11s115 gene=Ihof_evmTU11s115
MSSLCKPMGTMNEFKTRQWHHQDTKGDGPSRRSGHTLVADSTGNYMYTFGGYDDGKCYGELFQLHIASMTWTRIKTTGNGPDVSASHSAIVDGPFLLVFGGSGVPFGHSNSNHLHICDLRSFEWKRLECTGDYPCGRYGQTMVMSDNKEDLYVFGGTSGLVFYSDLYRLHLPTRIWHKVIPVNAGPTPCYRHEAIMYDTSMYVIGGGAPNPIEEGPLQIQAYDTLTNSWGVINCHPEKEGGPMPANRRSHTCTLNEGKVYVTGGTNGTTVFAETWILDMKTFSWKELPTNGFEGRYFHAAAITAEGRLHMFGGCLDAAGKKRSGTTTSCWIKSASLCFLCASRLARDHTLTECSLRRYGLPDNVIDIIRSEQ